MFRSIRTKVVVSYAVIILLCLLLAGLGALILIRRYQREAVLSRNRAIAATISQQVQTALTLRVRFAEIVSRVRSEADRLGARVLLVRDDGLILANTGEENSRTGQRLRILLDDLAGTQASFVRRYRDQDGSLYFLVISPLRLPAALRAEAASLPSHLVVAIPEQVLGSAWRELVPSLAIAGVASLCISLLVAFFVSRSITRPIVAMTAASEQIARGNYEHVIPAEGQDEVARLAGSFNRMAREVERSGQAQRDFLANVSHDLKTPLTSIQGFSQAILEGAIDNAQGYQRAAQIIREESERMGQLIQSLLELARLEAGEATQQREAVAPVELLQHCAEKFSPLASEAGLELAVYVPQDMPTILGNKARLEQAVSNLLDNAIKYTSPGGRIEASLHSLKLPIRGSEGGDEQLGGLASQAGLVGPWVAIRVQDTGPGIPQEDLPYLFERFYRVDKSRSGTKGSGLGLAIAKEIVEAHGGAIRLHSELGHGSSFVIFLPIGQR